MRHKKIWNIHVLLVILAIMVSVILLIPIFLGPGTNWNALCRTNFMAVHINISTYQDKNKGTNPPYKYLRKKLANNQQSQLCCPIALRYNKSPAEYVYRGADLTINSPPEMILLHCPCPCHHGKRNVLFVGKDDMFIDMEFLTEEEFKAAIARDNAFRRELGLPEKDLNGQEKE